MGTTTTITRLALVPLLALAAACGGDGGAGPADPGAERAAELARVHGCASCHGAEGEGGLGPPWQGLAGSEVELADGTTVIADAEYLRRAIADPPAQQRAGYAIPMPQVPLSDEEVDLLVAHVQTFG